ncbi:MAG: YbaK/EbsC family protein [Limnochordales bacterium]|nr:YbaK/EbsC family protein [Limnochordales bacterium]
MSAAAAKERVRAVLREKGVDTEIVEFAQSTRTAQEAADAIGTSVAQIVKSLVFVAGGQPVLALVSGANQADTDKLGALLGAPVERADARTVREATGFAIGGVPPVAHATPMPTFIDEDLLKYDELFAAAGTPHAVFRITPDELVRITGGRVVPLAR